jgi:hypothetical protein
MSKCPALARHWVMAGAFLPFDRGVTPMKTLIAAALACACALPAAAAEGWAGPERLQTLAGTWISPAPEPWYGGWGTREFVFRDGQWSLIFTHALDPAMTLRTFQFRTGGGYEIGAPAQVEGAHQALFREDWKHVTLLTADAGLAAAMGMGACGLTVNLETDISATGCAAWKPVADCGEDHDILAMNPEGGLHFGQRPADNDMCTPDRRPAALLPAVVAR